MSFGFSRRTLRQLKLGLQLCISGQSPLARFLLIELGEIWALMAR
jgi:hypothetical protein